MSGRTHDGSKEGGKRKSTKGSKPDWYGDKDKGGTWNNGKGRAKAKVKAGRKSDVATIVGSKGTCACTAHTSGSTA